MSRYPYPRPSEGLPQTDYDRDAAITRLAVTVENVSSSRTLRRRSRGDSTAEMPPQSVKALAERFGVSDQSRLPSFGGRARAMEKNDQGDRRRDVLQAGREITQRVTAGAELMAPPADIDRERRAGAEKSEKRKQKETLRHDAMMPESPQKRCGVHLLGATQASGVGHT